jgi:hypothetical protein
MLKPEEKKVGRGSRKESRLELEEIDELIVMIEFSSCSLIDRLCSVECGSRPLLLVDAVEIFLRSLDLSENQNGASLLWD